MRFALLLSFALVACGPDPGYPIGTPIDLDAATCVTGTFQIVAPVQGEHYATDLAVLVDFAELDPDLGDVTMSVVDDTGASYTPNDSMQIPSTTQAPFYRWRFDYTLAPGRRYELIVMPVEPLCNPTTQSVTFFTSSP